MSITTQAVGPIERVTFPALTPADRSCANPSAQALVRVAKGGIDLLFDGHAYALAEPALAAQGWELIEDIREAVLNVPDTIPED